MDHAEGTANSRGTARITRRRIRRLGVLLAFVVGATLIILLTGGETIRYQGVDVDRYLEYLGHSGNHSRYQDAVRAIAEIGPDGLPHYVEVAYGDRPWFAKQVHQAHLRHKNAFTEWLNAKVNPPVIQVRQNGAKRAIAFFKDFGEPHPVTNDLARIIQTCDSYDLREAARLINHFGGNSAAVVEPWLAPTERVALAFGIIADCGPAGSNAIPALVLLYQQHPEYAADVFATLKMMGDVSRPLFADALKAGNTEVATTALRFVRTDPGMLPHVLLLLSDHSPGVRSAAALTIADWRVTAENRVNSSLREDSFDDAFQAVIGVEADPGLLLDELDRMFDELDEFERVRVATAYCLYAGTDNRCMAFLEERLQDGSRTKRVEAKRAIRTIENYRNRTGEGDDEGAGETGSL